MTEFANLSFRVDSRELDDATRGLTTLDRAAKRTEQGIDRLGRTANIAFAAAGAGLAAFTVSSINVGRELENVQTRMRFLTDSTEEAAAATQSLQRFASTVPFEFRAISQAAPSLLVVAESTDELNQLLRITGDIAAATGLSFEQTASQLQRAMSAGIASADLFRERGIGAMLGFQQGVTVSAEETKKQIIELWETGRSTMVGASAEMAENWDGIVSMLMDKWFLFRGAVVNAGPFEFLKAAMAEVDSRLSDNFDSINDAAESTGEVIVQTFEDIIRAGAIAVDVMGPPLELIAGAVGDMWSTFQALPDDVQAAGLVGALLFGKKGLVILAAGASAVNNIAEITNLVEEQRIARQLETVRKRIDQAEETLREARAAFSEGFSDAVGRGDQTTAIRLDVDVQEAQRALAGLRQQQQELIDNPVPDIMKALFGSDEEGIGKAQSRVEEFLDSVHERINRAKEDVEDLNESGGLTGAGSPEDEKDREKRLKALEDERKAIEAIVDSALPYQAAQKQLVVQIAQIDAAIKKETDSTDQLVKARIALEQQLTSLRDITQDTIRGHEDTVEQLQLELEAMREGEDAYRRFILEQENSEEARRRVLALQEQGVDLSDEEIARINDLTRAEIELQNQIREEGRAREESNRAWQAFVTEIAGAFISSTGSMGDAFGDLTGRLQRELLNSGIGVLFGFEQGSTPLLSGISQLTGIGSAAGGGGFSLSNLFSAGSLLPGAETRLFDLTNQLVAQGGILADAGVFLNNSFNNLAKAPGGLVGGGLMSAGAGFVGGQLGQAVFGGEAGLGTTIGGIGGTLVGSSLLPGIGGPLGSAIGAFVGSAVDKLIGGDGPEVRAAVFAGTDASRAEPKWTVDLRETLSGLRLAGEAQRVGPEGEDAVRSMVEALAGIDAALTEATRSAGFAVDLSGAAFGSFAPGQEGARDFVRQWIDEVSRGFDDELEMAAATLGGDSATQLAAGFESLLKINEQLSSGGEIFAGIDSLSETLGLLQGRFAETGEGLADTLGRLTSGAALLAAVGEDVDNSTQFFERAATALRGLGSQRAADMTAFGLALGRINDLLSEDRILRDYEIANRTLFETYQAQTAQIEELSANLNNAADFANLENALLARYDTELQLISQIDGALQSVRASFDATIESIFVDGLETERERYEFFRAQADEVAQSILSLEDPGQIQAAAEQYNQLVGRAYQSLSEESQNLLRDDILSTVTEMREITAGLLEDLRGDVTGGGDVGEVIRSETQQALQQLRQAVQEAVETVSQQQAETSRQSTELVNSLNQWAAGLPESIRVQIAGSEVAF